MKHYTDYPSFTEAFAAFAHEARRHGFSVGIQGSKETIITALEGIWLDKDLFEHGLASIFCTSEEERKSFSGVYSRFWRPKGSSITNRIRNKNKKVLKKRANPIAVMIGDQANGTKNTVDEAKSTSGSNKQETLRYTDFSKLTLIESALIEELADRLLKEMSFRIKRKRKKDRRGSIDISNSIRKNIQKGGNLMNLAFRNRKNEKFRLLILLDASGSMDKYSFYFLRFIWALRSHFKYIESFVFSTRLIRITDMISNRNLEEMLGSISHSATHWSGGTRIGECLQDFNENYSKKYLNGKTMTIMLSDGLDTGDPVLLSRQIQLLKRRSKRLIWLNPLKGMEGYMPIQRGMAAALPSLDHFSSAHNLDSLLELENLFIHA